jgi:hypothetical protein
MTLTLLTIFAIAVSTSAGWIAWLRGRRWLGLTLTLVALIFFFGTTAWLWHQAVGAAQGGNDGFGLAMPIIALVLLGLTYVATWAIYIVWTIVDPQRNK